MSLAGCQIDPIDINFHIQKSLEMFDKKSANKIWSKKDKEIKVSPLVPIRVKKQNKKHVTTVTLLKVEWIKKCILPQQFFYLL